MNGWLVKTNCESSQCAVRLLKTAVKTLKASVQIIVSITLSTYMNA